MEPPFAWLNDDRGQPKGNLLSEAAFSGLIKTVGAGTQSIT
jgi:hypothetical protein